MAAIVCKHCGRDLDSVAVKGLEAEHATTVQTSLNVVIGDRELCYIIGEILSSAQKSAMKGLNPPSILGKEIFAPDEIIETIYRKKMVPLEKGDWEGVLRMQKMSPPRNDKNYIRWMKELVENSWVKGGRTPEGAMVWLNNNSPKFGLFSSLSKVDGEIAAETLYRFLAGFAKEVVTKDLANIKTSLFDDLMGVFCREKEVPKGIFDSALNRKDNDKIYQSDDVRKHIRSSIAIAFSNLEQKVIGRDDELNAEIAELGLVSNLHEFINDLKSFIPEGKTSLVDAHQIIRVPKYIDGLEASELAKGWFRSEVDKAVGLMGAFDSPWFF